MPKSDECNFIVGSTGTIGASLLGALAESNTKYSSRDNSSKYYVDLSVDSSAWKLPEYVKTAYILAAQTNINYCENYPEESSFINVTQTLRLAENLSRRGAHVILVSTNLIFPCENAPARTSDKYSPTCEYASQKLKLEQKLSDQNIESSILRITKIAETMQNLIQSWKDSLLNGVVIEPFEDLICSPIPSKAVIDHLIDLGSKNISEVRHISGDIDLNYAEIAHLLAEELKLEQSLIQPTTSLDKGVLLKALPKVGMLEPSIGGAKYDSKKAIQNVIHKLDDA